MTEDNIHVKTEVENFSDLRDNLDNLQASNINITDSSQHSSRNSVGEKKMVCAPENLDSQVLSWIKDYLVRESSYYDQDDLLVLSTP